MVSRFLRVRCPRCGTAHIIFGKASTRVKCNACKLMLVRTEGGKARMKGAIHEIL